MAFVYILFSQAWDKYYIGSTTDLERRILDHNYGNTKSTKHGRPLECVFRKECASLSEARCVERQLKARKSRDIIMRVGKRRLRKVVERPDFIGKVAGLNPARSTK